MQTYSELKGEPKFNWFQALKVENKTDAFWETLHEKSQDWVTCACGNQCDIIPRDQFGRPIDDELRILGFAFNEYVRKRSETTALNILEKIEERSEYLISQIKKQ